MFASLQKRPKCLHRHNDAMCHEATSRQAHRHCALNWKTCLSHALDTALEIIGIFIWQDTPLPLD